MSERRRVVAENNIAKSGFASKSAMDDSGFTYVTSHLNIGTSFGLSALRDLMDNDPYMPGSEEELRQELERVQKVKNFVEADGRKVGYIYIRVFHDMRDTTLPIERSSDSTLTMVELFRVKRLLLQMWRLRDIIRHEDLPPEYVPDDVTEILDILDPQGERKAGFYIYDEFSERLTALRKKRNELRDELRVWQNEQAESVLNVFGVKMSPTFEISVMKADHIMVSHLRASGILKQVDRDSASALFVLEDSRDSAKIKSRIEKVEREIADEEDAVRERLSREIWEHHKLIYSNCSKIGRLDLALAKAVFARAHGCVKPEITDEHRIMIEDGRNLMVDSVLRKQGREFKPVSLELRQGVTCVTGTNMAGKTVTVKLIAQSALLAQYGFFVPCARAVIGLSGCIEMLTSDTQSLANGLSSFGGEMAELAGVFSRRIPRTLLMVAEIANGTNPEEGSAITRGVIEFMKDRFAITVLTTHYDIIKKGDFENNIRHMVMDENDRSIRPCERDDPHVPCEALRTAEELGMDDRIIAAAREWMKSRDR